MKFLADMGISPKAVDFLSSLGFDAIHLHREGLQTLSDPDILTKARIEERVILTHDLDFGELVAAGGTTLPSVITFRLRNMHPERVNHVMEEIVSNHLEALQQGAIIVVTEGKLRVRSLPLKSQDG